MTDDTFLQAIYHEPGDDLHRLAYADWLSDHGDPRGEFIQVQCQLARMDESDPHYPLWRGRERGLLDQHKQDWLGEVGPLAKDGRFRRGLLDEVAFAPPAFLAVELPPCPPTVRRVLVDLEAYEIAPALIELLPESVARDNLVLVFGLRPESVTTSPDVIARHSDWLTGADRPALIVAMANPDDDETFRKLMFILNREIVPVRATSEQLTDAIDRHYGNSETESVDSILYIFPPELGMGEWPD